MIKISEIINVAGHIIASNYYTFQKARIAFMNKARDLIRRKVEGIGLNETEEKKENKTYDKKYKDSELIEQFLGLFTRGEITKTEYDFMSKCWEMIAKTKDIENENKKLMIDFVEQTPIYQDFLSKIRGIGPVLSANLIKEFGDCSKYDTISKLWAHTGNHVVDNKAPKIHKDMKFNPKLRTLTWKIGESLMKLDKGYYRILYIAEKLKQLKREYEPGYLKENFNGYKEESTNLSKGHAHNRAMRKIRKRFLDHFWFVSREMNGLPTQKNYIEGIKGHTDITTWREMLDMENLLKEERSVIEKDPRVKNIARKAGLEMDELMNNLFKS